MFRRNGVKISRNHQKTPACEKTFTFHWVIELRQSGLCAPSRGASAARNSFAYELCLSAPQFEALDSITVAIYGRNPSICFIK